MESKKIFGGSPEFSQEELEKMYNLCTAGSEAPIAIIIDGVFISRATLKIPEVAEFFDRKLVEMRLRSEEKEANRKKFLDGLRDPYKLWREQNERGQGEKPEGQGEKK